MNKDFHYYATACAAFFAGYSPKESIEIGYASQFTDCCTRTLLSKAGAPRSAATTQTQSEIADSRIDIIGLQDITRIWTSFHFLPRDLTADAGKKPKLYKNKYRLICGPNGPLAADTVNLAKGRSTEAAGLSMHVLADTWAHAYFAGTPSYVINNTNAWFYEILPDSERQINFRHNPRTVDDPEQGIYVGSARRSRENSVMNLGHGRAGHLPDYSFIKYRYLPAWGEYEEILKNNPVEYYNAFCQMIRAMRYLRGAIPEFKVHEYDDAAVPYESEIKTILRKRQIDSCGDWKAFAEKLMGCPMPDFDVNVYVDEYIAAEKDEKDNTPFGRYIIAALAQKSMVTGKIFRTGNLMVGYAVDFREKGFKGIKDFAKLVAGREETK